MAELTLHFEIPPGTDMNAAAVELQKKFSQLDDVAVAETKPQRFQAIGAQEVLAVIKFATSVAETTAALLTAIAAVNEAWQKVKVIFPEMHAPTVEIGLKKIPIDQVTETHLQQISAD